MAGDNSQTMIPMIAPDGSIGDVPQSQMTAAIAKGFHVGVNVTSPDGQQGVIPAHNYQAAAQKGFKINTPSPTDAPPPQKEGFLGAAGSDLLNMAKGIVTPQAQNPYPGMGTDQKVAAFNQAQQQGQQEQAAGYGLPYRAAGAVAQAAGVNVPGMEQAAAQGDTGGVVGHAVAGAAPYVAGAAVNLAGDAAARAAQNKMAAAAPDLYRSALKPTTVPSKQAAVQAGIRTGLDNAIPVSQAGLEKLSGLIDDTNQKIAAVIQADPTRPIDPTKVAQRVDQVRPRFANQVNPTADLNAIDASKQEFLQNNLGPSAPGGTGPRQMTPLDAADAQAMKQGTYQQVKKNYGTLSNAAVESQKALARGLKEELATAFPELNDLNAQDSKFYGLEPILERAVARISNHQLIGIGTPAAGMAAKAVTGSSPAAAVAGVMKAVVDNPNVKSRLAIMLNKASKGQITLPQAMARVAAYSTALGQGSPDDSGQPASDQSSQ